METLESRVAKLETRVGELEDLREIQELRFRYHIAVNERRLDDIAPLFCEDGTADFGQLGSAKGRAAIAALYREVVGGSPMVKQFTHNHAIELAGDSATGLSYMEAKTVYDGQSTLIAARFDDAYLRDGGRWCFREIKIHPFFVASLGEGWADARDPAISPA